MRRMAMLATRSLAVMMVLAASAPAAELRQAQVPHQGMCDASTAAFEHNLTIWTNTTGQTVTNVLTRIVSGGTGVQGYYTTRHSDNFITAFGSGSGIPAPGSRNEYDKPVTFAPGDSLRFVHWCYPPDVYTYWIFFDYLIP